MINRKNSRIKRAIAVSLVSAMISTTSYVPFFKGMTVLAKENQEVADNLGREVRNVMYYGEWSIWGGQDNFYPKDIPADKLTHLNFAFLDFDENGELIFTDLQASTGAEVGEGSGWDNANSGILMALQNLRAENPNLKIGVSLGGWSKSGDFSVVANDPQKRANFVKNVMKFIEYTNMDFVDVDWEFPGEVRQPDLVDNKNDEGTPNAIPEDKENYITLLQEFREALNEQGKKLDKDYELSVALPAPKYKVDLGIDVDALFNVVDFANIMTYDMRGAWDERSGHQTGLYPNSNEPEEYRQNNLSIDESVQYFLENGAEPEKIVIGAAYYTRGWDKVSGGTDSENPGLFGEAEVSAKDADQSPSKGAVNEADLTIGDGGRRGGVWSYRNIDKLKALYPNLKEYWDDEAKAPYMYDETTGVFFTYDNTESIKEKTEYVKENNLGGMIGWMASQDAQTNSSKRDELTTATKEGLFGDEKLTEHEIKYSELDVSVSIEPYEDQWGANPKGYYLTIKNNEKSEEGNPALAAVENGAETIKLPKIYVKGDFSKSSDYTAGKVSKEGDYTVFDLSSINGTFHLKQGESYTLKISGDEKIENILLAQVISKGGSEIGKQVIYGDGKSDTETPQKNEAPVFKGTSNKTINVGDSFDPMAGVTATDKEDGDLTNNIKATGEVDTEVAGKYQLKYTVTDSEGATTEANRTIIVEAKEEEVPEKNQLPVLKGITDKTIKVGEVFDKMAEVTATDKEDGDLTSSISVTGEVNTEVADKYQLTYTVSDSQGAVATATRTITVIEEAVNPPSTVDYGVGQGIEWPSQVNAPFVDMVAWVGDTEYGNNGAANLVKLYQDTGVKFFNLGFIQSINNTIKDGKVQWGWGGFSVLNEENTDTDQYNGIKKSIRELRELGGDVTISLGGLNGITLWDVTQDVDVLANTYRDIINGYGLTRLDLDIEGAAQEKTKNIANAKAIKKVQDETGVKIVLTVPVLPSGLTQMQLDVLEAYLANGVDVEVVNIMTMCYGNGTLLPGENYGTASLRAVESTKEQVQDYFKKFANIQLSDSEAYRKIGTTVSIGFEGSAHPIFTTEWSKLVVDQAIEKGIGMTSFWSMNRDAMFEKNQGVSSKYEFTNIFKAFGSNGTDDPVVNSKPTIYGVNNKEIAIGDTFDPMEGITASDKEDGDLTSKITIEGQVDTSKAGSYKLVYKVQDSEGLEEVKECTIKVKEVSDLEDTYDPTKIYYGGEIVIYKGKKYVAKWWTQGEAPDSSENWELITEANEDGSVDYIEGKAYEGGVLVRYNSKTYESKWWTQSVPGSDDSWKLVE